MLLEKTGTDETDEVALEATLQTYFTTLHGTSLRRVETPAETKKLDKLEKSIRKLKERCSATAT